MSPEPEDSTKEAERLALLAGVLVAAIWLIPIVSMLIRRCP